MKILFNKIFNHDLTQNQKLLQKAFSETIIENTHQITHFGICNWSGFGGVIINDVEYLLPTNVNELQYFNSLENPINADITILPSQISGLAKIGSLFLGVVFNDLKSGKVESRKFSTTNKTKETLTGINFISHYGVQYLEYSAQCPPLLNSETSQHLLHLLMYNNNRNVLVEFECNEFGSNQKVVYGHLDSSIIATQGLNVYGTKVKITERF